MIRAIVLMTLLSCLTSGVFALSEQEKSERLALIKRLKGEGEMVFAIVPKTTENPFFSTAARGCADRAGKIGVHCIYFGSVEQNMRLQVEDIATLLAAGIDGLAISGIKNSWIADSIGARLKEWGKPVVAFDSPLDSKIAATYIGTDNYAMGRALGEEIRKLKPIGGSYCIQISRSDSPNQVDRLRGIIDAMTRDGEDLAMWNNVYGCPLKHFGDFERATKQMGRVLKSFEIDVFIGTGGGAQVLPDHYRKVIGPFREKIQSGQLVIANIDTLPVQMKYLEEGIATVNVGQWPYEMGGWSAIVLKMMTEGEVAPALINTGLSICNQANFETCAK